MDNETLRKLLPNYIQPGMGEDKLIDKIAPYIDAAETWANGYIATSEFTDHYEHLKPLRDDIVAARALYLAAPALDVTMHPNGLAVVNTDSLAPASVERSREFRKTLDRQTIDSIDRFIAAVTSDEAVWSTFYLSNPLTNILRASIFYNCADLIAHTGIEHSWDQYINTLRKISAIEVDIAEKFISWALLTEMRANKGPQAAQESPLYINAIQIIKRVLADALKEEGKHLLYERLRIIVNEIRKHPDVFPQWHNSDTAKLYDPPVFRNDRNSGGYFF